MKFEYMERTCQWDYPFQLNETNELGAEGWEVVLAVPARDDHDGITRYKLFLKRQVA